MARRSLGRAGRPLGRTARGALGFGAGALIGGLVALAVRRGDPGPSKAADIILSALVGGIVVGSTGAVTAVST